MGLCELENIPETPKCPKTFVHTLYVGKGLPFVNKRFKNKDTAFLSKMLVKGSTSSPRRFSLCFFPKRLSMFLLLCKPVTPRLSHSRTQSPLDYLYGRRLSVRRSEPVSSSRLLCCCLYNKYHPALQALPPSPALTKKTRRRAWKENYTFIWDVFRVLLRFSIW